MKKLIFILLLAQTISFLYGDAGCLGSAPAHGYHGYNENPGDEWGMRISSPKHTNCDCNCVQHARAHNKCINCGHINVPKDLKISHKQIIKTEKKSKTEKTCAQTTKNPKVKKTKKVKAYKKSTSQPVA